MKHLLFALIFLFGFRAWADGRAGGSGGGWLCSSHGDCQPKGVVSSKSAGPKGGSTIRVNPSAVPVEKVWGAMAIYYKSDFDFVLVKGLGRIGAAISPSAGEESFFGAPGFEIPEDYLERMNKAEKLRANKLTLAGSWEVYSNGKAGMKRFNLNLGLMLKQNHDTGTLTGGYGFSGVIGFLTYGYSVYGDQSRLDYSKYGSITKPLVTYAVETYSAGVFLESFIFDYSVLRLLMPDVITVKVATGTLLFNRLILTAAHRVEDSVRAKYDHSTRDLDNQRTRSEVFGGVQFRVAPFLMLGAFYNYYLLHEASVGATLHF